MYIFILYLRKINVKDFMKKYNLKNDTMDESRLQTVYIHPIYPRDSKKYSDKGFVKKIIGLEVVLSGVVL